MSVARHAKSAVIWSAGLTVFREVVLRLVTVMVFRRLLATTDYGIFSFVNSVVGFLAMFGFTNFVAYTVQVREEKDVHWQEQFTGGAFFQIPLFVIANLVAMALRWFPVCAPIAPYLHILSVLFLLDWPCEFRRKMLERAFNWPRLRGLTAIGMVIGTLLALDLALAGKGAYALLLPVLMFSPPFIYDLFVTARWRPTWAWSWEKYRAAWRFGLVRTTSGIAIRGRQLIESSVVAGVLGLGPLGILGGATGLAQLSCQVFTDQLLSSIYPVLTRVNPDPHNVSRVNALLLRFVAWVVIPVTVLASALAAPLLLFFYGDKWTATIPLLPWALLAAVFVSLNATANQLLLAQERLKQCLAADIILLLGVVLALGLGLPYGLKAYLAALAAVQAAVFGLMLFWLVRTGGLRLTGITLALGPAVLAATAAWAAGGVILHASGFHIQGIFQAAGCAVLFGVGYLAILRGLFAGALGEIMAYVPGRKILGRILLIKEP
jgi:teichuronic acid exporter